ncbi:pro-sigmaK processing inhibitor BofA family protein [Alkalihalobacillus hemicellulosilyticus]|uniref:Inhibitor of pro-sigmaK processing BofA n=1 Tax=Halalkalibacter hemicellulosilyticusJCM 9152 TaxID=1236971 RepID=W4QN20_9BACI|nr:pro-sigmaK processing inhibitor BofA family protein [Halalkalibacter hemicellulosilyticus]GAE32749.1 inhibitor of pro-sigmaK processing BofA [Halalkalibacter hemicellulosilyticusJCM 9152]
MEPILVILLLVGLVFILLLVGAPVKPLRFAGGFIVKCLIGVLMLFFVNVLGATIGLYVPINGVTTIVSGLLGVPGIALLIGIAVFFI